MHVKKITLRSVPCNYRTF